jgi:hypothetical protein
MTCGSVRSVDRAGNGRGYPPCHASTAPGAIARLVLFRLESTRRGNSSVAAAHWSALCGEPPDSRRKPKFRATTRFRVCSRSMIANLSIFFAKSNPNGNDRKHPIGITRAICSTWRRKSASRHPTRCVATCRWRAALRRSSQRVP